jgi:hypothetical protein
MSWRLLTFGGAALLLWLGLAAFLYSYSTTTQTPRLKMSASVVELPTPVEEARILLSWSSTTLSLSSSSAPSLSPTVLHTQVAARMIEGHVWPRKNPRKSPRMETRKKPVRLAAKLLTNTQYTWLADGPPADKSSARVVGVNANQMPWSSTCVRGV